MARHKDGWIILRTSGAKTIPLSESLAQAGFDVWTPREIKQRKRTERAKGDIQCAIAPTFVFARSRHIGHLMEIRALPMSPHPPFSVFTDRQLGIPVIRDVEIAGFRAAEAAANANFRKTRHRKVSPGESVKPTDGPFAGLTGQVKRVAGQYAVVLFDGFEVKIATWLLPDDVIRTSQSHSDTAARAA